MKKEYKKTIKLAYDFYGKEHQFLKCIEEMSELTKEIAKEINNTGNRKNLAEELADTMITLEYVKFLVDKEELDEVLSYKIRRLETNILEELDESFDGLTSKLLKEVIGG